MKFVSVFLLACLAFAPVATFADFWVSIASYKQRDEADAALDKLSSQSDEDFRVRGIETTNGFFYRIVLGPYETRKQALQAQSEIQLAEVRSSWIWQSASEAPRETQSEIQVAGEGSRWIWQSASQPPQKQISTQTTTQGVGGNSDVLPTEKPPSGYKGDESDEAYGANRRNGFFDDDFDESDYSRDDEYNAYQNEDYESTSPALNEDRSRNLQRDGNLLIDSAMIQQVGDEGRVRRSAIESAVIDQLGSEAEKTNTNSVEPLIRRQRLSVGRVRRDDGIERVTIAEAPKFPIDVEFANVPIDVAAQMLSEIIGKNIILGSEVEGNLNLAFYGVPWDVALATILSVKGLAQYEDKSTGIIRWHEPRVLDKWLEAEVKRAEELRRQELANQTIIPTETEIFRLFYEDPEVVELQLEEIFNGRSANEGTSSASKSASNVGRAGRLLGATSEKGGFSDTTTRVDISANSANRQLIVRASEEDLDLIAQLIEQIDQPAQQVMIEAFIVEVTDDFERQLGSRLSVDRIDGSGDYRVRTAGTLTGANDEDEPGLSLASSAGTVFNLTAPGANTALGFLLDGARLKVELSALEQEGYSRTISSPRLLAFDNEEATIFQGIEVPYTTVSNNGTQTEFKEAGLKLSVTPSVIGDGRLVLAVTVNQDTVETTRENPPITTREISTRLLVDDGGMAVLGGIYLQQESASGSRVPVLGKVPVIGRLFKSKQSREDRRELLIFIVPTII